MQSIHILADSINNFTKFLLIGTQANTSKINEFLDNSLMLVTALSPIIGYDKAAQLAHYAHHHNCTLKEANNFLKFVANEEFDRLIDPSKMVNQET